MKPERALEILQPCIADGAQLSAESYKEVSALIEAQAKTIEAAKDVMRYAGHPAGSYVVGFYKGEIHTNTSKAVEILKEALLELDTL
jgi:hypothetical protein